MMMAGVMWMMAGGNPERINSAKSWIFAALTGLILAVASYMILNMVNPDLVKIGTIKLDKVKGVGCCENPKTGDDKCALVKQEDCPTSGWKGENFYCHNDKCVAVDEDKGCCVIFVKTGPSTEQICYRNWTENECKREQQSDPATKTGYSHISEDINCENKNISCKSIK